MSYDGLPVQVTDPLGNVTAGQRTESSLVAVVPGALNAVNPLYAVANGISVPTRFGVSDISRELSQSIIGQAQASSGRCV